MGGPIPNEESRWHDLMLADEFAEKTWTRWANEARLERKQLDNVRFSYAERREKWRRSQSAELAPPADLGLASARPGEHAIERSLRQWGFLQQEISRFTQRCLISLAQSHDLQAEVRERRAALERKLAIESYPEALPIDMEIPAKEPRPARPATPRRPLMEILLDPRNIQWLLALGGSLMVVGLVILVWVNKFFTPPVVAVSLGLVNIALLGGGWWVLRQTRYRLAGRAMTLLACLVMPLNLWYYHVNDLVTIDGHLWVAALVISLLYAASALVLRDELFVFVAVSGVTLTGLLILADLPPSPQRFWEIASPATLLVVLGLASIHAERVFPEQEGPFSRKRFGLAFFWSGHALLAAGLLLVLGAQIAGDWLYQPVFKHFYDRWHATPSPIVSELRLLAIGLVIAGAYAYVYSDLVVRRAAVYLYLAAFTLLWAQILVLEQLGLNLGPSAWITVLASTALGVHLVYQTVVSQSRATRALPVLGVILGLAANVLGVVACLRAISLDLRSIWQTQPPSWHFTGSMALTAVACRFGAFVYRRSDPHLTAVSLFSTAAAVLVGATAFLAVIGLDTWEKHAPILMLIPIAYLVVAQFYRGRTEEQPLVWISYTATGVMLIASVASALQGFTHIVEGQPLNLALALFCAEAAGFFGITAVYRRHESAVHLCAALACGAVWQLMTYLGWPGEYYTLTFALVGLGMLIGYRFAVLERFAIGRMADAAFQSANTLLSLSFLAATFMGLSRLAADKLSWSLMGLCLGLTLVSLVAVALVRQTHWRRWYVATTIGLGLLTFLVVQALSILSPWQKLEIFCVVAGMLLLIVGHVGWYREQDRQSDLVSVSLFLGSLLAGLPLAVAALVDRSQDHFRPLNEIGFLAVSVLLLCTGFLFQLRSTTLIGAALTVLYFITLLVYVPWNRLSALAIFITVSGGLLFGTGLLLSFYRDRLLQLPDKVKRREGLFRVLNWR
jgi:hypothetical protein